MKKRLDILLCERGLLPAREKAKAIIMEGLVFVNNQKADKPGMAVDEEDQIEVRGETLQYVSRGGLKLEKAIAAFGLDLAGCVCADVGASTGGFTDCMLQNGAAKVYAVDVGYGQLAWTLRTDGRVVVLERTNIRYLTQEQIPEEIDFVSVDVSFISLKLVLPVVHRLLREGGGAVCLIKPQFEAGRTLVGKNGVVRDSHVHRDVIRQVLAYAKDSGLFPRKLDFSPIKGPKGNIEFLIWLQKGSDEEQPAITEAVVADIVERARQGTSGEE